VKIKARDINRVFRKNGWDHRFLVQNHYDERSDDPLDYTEDIGSFVKGNITVDLGFYTLNYPKNDSKFVIYVIEDDDWANWKARMEVGNIGSINSQKEAAFRIFKALASLDSF